MNVGGRLDSSQNQVAGIEVALMDIAIMIAPKLLLLSRMLSVGFILVVVLDAQSTKSYVRWQDCFRTVHHEEWRVVGSPASLCA